MNARIDGFRLVVLMAILLFALTFQIAVSEQWPSTEDVQWVAVGSAATVVVASASMVGLAGLGLVASQTAANRRQARVQFGPYLRIDFAPDSDLGTWRPPKVDDHFDFDWAAFNSGQDEPETPLSGWRSPEGFDLCVWMTNRQTAAGGTAINVAVDLEIVVADVAQPDATLRFTYELRVHYLEPDRCIRYRVARLSPDIPYLRGEVRRVAYLDPNETALAFAYGSSAFEWDGERLDNKRQSFREAS